MDITFKCPNCEQELEVDESGAGSKIECPSCSSTITVPGTPENIVPLQSAPPPKAERHFTVPISNAPAKGLIAKSLRPLEVAAKDSDKKMRIKTFKRTECQEVGKDHFDEIVSAFLDKVGQANIVSINPINYSTIDLGTHQTMTDFGVMIVFRG